MQKELIHERYLLLKLMHSGSYSSVFQAWDYNLEKFVTVKKIQKHVPRPGTTSHSLRSELLNLARLEHENITQIYDFFSGEGNAYYVILEYMWGKDLAQVMKRSRERETVIPSDVAISIVTAAAAALCYAHETGDNGRAEAAAPGTLHLNLSPENILLYTDGRIKVTNFGIAGTASNGSRFESETRNLLSGKFHYRSPEQVAGIPADQRSDLFSLGTIFYELLTGIKPFDGESNAEIESRTLKTDPDFSLVPEDVREMVRKMLEKEPRNRYASLREFMEALERRSKKLYGEVRQSIAAAFLAGLFPELQTIERNERDLTREIVRKVTSSRTTEQEDLAAGAATLSAGTLTEADAAPDASSVQDLPAEGRNRRAFPAALVLLLFFLLPFEILFDIPYSITPVGKYIKSIFLPASICIESVPPGAEVYLDGRKSGFTTPFHVFLEAQSYRIGLAKDGFLPMGTGNGKNGACTLDLLGDRHRMNADDWQLSTSVNEGRKIYKLTGLLKREVLIETRPSGALVFMRDSNEPAGKTPLTIPLGSSDTSLRLVRENHMPLTVNVAARSPGTNRFVFSLLPRAAPRLSAAPAPAAEPRRTIGLDIRDWFAYHDRGVQASARTVKEGGDEVLEIEYDLRQGEWLGVFRNDTVDLSSNRGVRFRYAGEGAANALEFKLVDADGTNYGRVLQTKAGPDGTWTQAEIPFEQFRYWWGGDKALDREKITIHFAVSRNNGGQGGTGKVYIRDFEAF